MTDTPTLQEVWGQYRLFKEKLWAHSTLRAVITIEKRIFLCPNSLEKARETRDFLIDNYSLDSARRTLKHISACIEWGKREGLVKNNPYHPFLGDFRKKRKQVDIFSLAEKDIVVEAYKGFHYYDFVRFLFKTGCRPSEAIGLLWTDIDPSMSEITFHSPVVDGVRKEGLKVEDLRRFPVNGSLKALLASLKRKEGPVFCSPKGSIIHLSNFNRRSWGPTLATLPIRYRRPYAARGFFITECLRLNIPVAVIARWVGNSPTTIYSHYAGLLDDYEVPDF
ncbi:MAG: hypothetical protein F6J93_02930 [Oscillatoria sp. SIO1A7]|nr:hypothetical protein [Oscillatoria sp. SIO1A7]